MSRLAASAVVALVSATGCAPSPTREELCAHPEAHVGEHVRVSIALADHAFWVDGQTQVACASAACCNTRTVGFDLCAGARVVAVSLVPDPALPLAATDYGPYLPQVYDPGVGDPTSITLGCLGCETGVSCSPADLTTVTAVSGRLTRVEGVGTADGRGVFHFVVDAL